MIYRRPFCRTFTPQELHTETPAEKGIFLCGTPVDIHAAAAFFSVPVATVEKWVKLGAPHTIRTFGASAIQRRPYFNLFKLEQWIIKQKTKKA